MIVNFWVDLKEMVTVSEPNKTSTCIPTYITLIQLFNSFILSVSQWEHHMKHFPTFILGNSDYIHVYEYVFLRRLDCKVWLRQMSRAGNKEQNQCQSIRNIQIREIFSDIHGYGILLSPSLKSVGAPKTNVTPRCSSLPSA